jgi:senataxin
MVGALLTDNFAGNGVPIHLPKPGSTNSSTAPMQKKLLVCAPSNAAVDELVVRLKAGVKTLTGHYQKINVVRLGRSDAINSNVKDVTLDELVKAKLEGDGKGGKLVVSEREKLHLEAARLKEELAVLRPKLEESRENGNKELERRLQREFDEKKRNQARIGSRIDENKDSGNTAARENEILRRKVQQEIMDSAHVLCATLSGSGHDMFTNLNVEFDTVVIDEAAQSIELSALIPLKYGCSKCILVGDPKQLPPTVLSRSAARYGYEQSLFVRMQQNHPNAVHLLDTQYRMHPDISRFPSTQFYDGKLIDGDNMAQLRLQKWHANELLGPYRFFDVKGTQSSGARGHSFINVQETNVALQLYHRLLTDYKSYDFRGKVGIITPYKAQLRELRSRFSAKYGEGILEEIDFNTTDAFQGREAEIIIFSCVRARATGGIGFLTDIRRMNVGLTRAKSSLWVLGDSQALHQGEFWSKLITDAKERGKYTEGNVLERLKKPSIFRSTATSNPTVPIVDRASGTSLQNSGRNRPIRDSVDDVEMVDPPDQSNIKGSTASMHENKTNPANGPSTNSLRPQPPHQPDLKLSSVTDQRFKRPREISPTETVQSVKKVQLDHKTHW